MSVSLRDSLNGHAKIAQFDLSKLYKNQFAYRFRLHISRFRLGNTKDDARAFAHAYGYREQEQSRAAAAYVLIALQIEAMGEKAGSIRWACTEFVFVYLRDEKDAVDFLGKWSSLITEATLPRSGKDLGILIDDAKICIRSTFYWGKYRWCLRMKNIGTKQSEEIRRWAFEYFEMPINSLSDRVYFKQSYPYQAYFRDENDAIIFRVAFSEHINSFEKILLKKEISDDDPPDSEVD